MEESPAYRFKVSLRLRHPESDLSSCSTEFALEPFRQWTIGHGRTSPRGVSLDGKWDHSYWTAPLEISPGEDLETSLARTAHWLAGRAPFLAAHQASGGSVGLFVGLFLEGFNSGFTLEPSLLAQYASLGVALEFDVYGPDDSPGAP